MNTLSKALARDATLCAICHDQCVSACPVVESSRRMSAYPSRLAMLALEIDRGKLLPDEHSFRALQDCISCGACLEGCVYVDKPNDITPVVRWARRAVSGMAGPELIDWVQRVRAGGSPYADTCERLSVARSALVGPEKGEPILVYTDAATLHSAPGMVTASIYLLQQLGDLNIHLAGQTYLGGELREYGYQEDFVAIAQRVAIEAAGHKPSRIIALHPHSAYLLREVYPVEAGVTLGAPVFTLAEALEQRRDRLTRPGSGKVFLVQSAAESYRMNGGAGQRLLESLGVEVLGKRAGLPYRDQSYPDGEVFGIQPDPRKLIVERIRAAIRQSGAKLVVTTSPAALAALYEHLGRVQLLDLSSYLIGAGKSS